MWYYNSVYIYVLRLQFFLTSSMATLLLQSISQSSPRSNRCNPALATNKFPHGVQQKNNSNSIAYFILQSHFNYNRSATWIWFRVWSKIGYTKKNIVDHRVPHYLLAFSLGLTTHCCIWLLSYNHIRLSSRLYPNDIPTVSQAHPSQLLYFIYTSY